MDYHSYYYYPELLEEEDADYSIQRQQGGAVARSNHGHISELGLEHRSFDVVGLGLWDAGEELS